MLSQLRITLVHTHMTEKSQALMSSDPFPEWRKWETETTTGSGEVKRWVSSCFSAGMMKTVDSRVSISYLLSLFLGTEVLDLQVVLLTVALAQLILLQLSLQIQLFLPDLGSAREDSPQRFWHPGDRDFFIRSFSLKCQTFFFKKAIWTDPLGV